MLTIYSLTLWSQNVLIESFWSEMNFPKRIINSYRTSWNKLAKLYIRKLTLTSQTHYKQFNDVGTYELLPFSQKSLKISNWNFTCILQGYIGIRKYKYLNFDQVTHLDPKSHGWSQLCVCSRSVQLLELTCWICVCIPVCSTARVDMLDICMQPVFSTARVDMLDICMQPVCSTARVDMLDMCIC